MATKILLVEDDKSLREIYSVRLQAEGYIIVAASDGEQALALAIKERPGLVITDVMMPKISGFDMLDILRSTAETRNIKVIMMTALSSDEQRNRGEKMGADRYLVKSQVGIEDVVRTVHEVLGDAGAASGASPAPTSAAPPALQPTLTPSTPVTDQSSATQSSATSTNTPGKPRVIQPLEGQTAKVDINELLDKELAKEAGLDAFSRPEVVSTEQEKANLDQQVQSIMQAPVTPAADEPTQDDSTATAEPTQQASKQPAERAAPTVPQREGSVQAPPRKVIPTI